MLKNNYYLAVSLRIAVVAAIISYTPQARAADAPAPIQAAYKAMDKALDQRNADAYAKWYMPGGFALMGGSKNHMPLAAAMQGEHETVLESQSVDSRSIIETADVQPDGTTVTLKRTLSITRIHPGTAILENEVIHVRAREHWINRGGKWQINRMRLLDFSQVVNGKIVKMGA